MNNRLLDLRIRLWLAVASVLERAFMPQAAVEACCRAFALRMEQSAEYKIERDRRRLERCRGQTK